MISKKVKYGLSISLIMIALGYGTYVYLDNTMKSTLYTLSEVQIFEEVSEIESESDIIAKVQATPNIINRMEYDADGLPLWYWTEREVVISKSFKGEAKVDDVITVLEPYAIGDNKVIGKLEIISEDYTKMVDEEEYILFLQKRDDGKYMTTGKDQGKITVGNNSSKPAGNTKFLKIHNEVKTKYQ